MKKTTLTYLSIASVLAVACMIAFGSATHAHDVLTQLNMMPFNADVASLLPSLLGAGMTTLAANKPRAFEIGTRNAFPMIGSDIIYEGAAVGLVDATGHARPLNAADRFAGFAESTADNSAGAAAAISARVVEAGKIQLAVTGVVITDVGQPVYATDDDTFTFLPTGAAFIGFVHRFVSAGVAIVAFDALNYRDPYGDYSVRETLSGIKTFDAEDSGKIFFVDADGDADALTLPAIADGFAGAKIVAIGAFGTTAVTISPAAADMILGPNITGADNKDLILTKATQRRGDFVKLDIGDTDGYVVTEMRGTWAREA
jgi:hypothetical protein